MKLTCAVAVCLAATPLFAAKETDTTKRLAAAVDVINDIMKVPEKSIPQDLLDKSECIVVVPGLKKAAFIIGGKYGKGFVTCRNADGTGWGAPGAVRVEGGSAGFQIGGSESDVVMLILNKTGAKKLLTSKFTLGGDIAAAAGPVGRQADAQTDALMHAEILTYSRSRGLFAGISLNGATLRQDLEDNRELYGKTIENSEIVMSGIQPPAQAAGFLSALNKYSSRKTQ